MPSKPSLSVACNLVTSRAASTYARVMKTGAAAYRRDTDWPGVVGTNAIPTDPRERVTIARRAKEGERTRVAVNHWSASRTRLTNLRIVYIAERLDLLRARAAERRAAA